MTQVQILVGDVFERLADIPDESVDLVVTSPPYWGLRDYGVEGQIGLEATLAEHLEVMVAVFDEVWRVLKPHGSCYINYGDCYATKPNGRSAADTKAAGNDDRTFRDKPMSTVGPIHPPEPGQPFPPGIGRRGGGNASAGPIAAPIAELVPDAEKPRDPRRVGGVGYGNGTPGARVVGRPPLAVFETQDNPRQRSRMGRSGNLGEGHEQGTHLPMGRVVAPSASYVPDYAKTTRGKFQTPNGRTAATRVEHSGRIVAGATFEQLSDERQASRGPRNRQLHDGRIKGGKPAAGLIRAGGYLKPKDLCMIPNRLAIALQDAGWWVRSEIVWGKPNPMPDSSGRYRPSTAHEKIWFVTKSGKSFYDAQAVKMPVSGGTHARVKQNIAKQAGSTRAYGGTRPDQPPMKAMAGKLIDVAPDSPLAGLFDQFEAAAPAGGSYPRPAGWDDGDGHHGSRHRDGRRKPGQNPKAAAPKSGIRSNTSMQDSTQAVVNERYLRNYEPDVSALVPPEVWEIATASYKDAHFATFPPALVVPCVLSGTSARGNCVTCGDPWVRCEGGWMPSCGCYDDMYRTFPAPRRARKRAQRDAYDARFKRLRRRPGAAQWVTAPAVVLDPFGGAGTTALVAQQLGRDSILIELNPEYAEMARARCDRGELGLKLDGGFFAGPLGEVYEGEAAAE